MQEPQLLSIYFRTKLELDEFLENPDIITADITGDVRKGYTLYYYED